MNKAITDGVILMPPPFAAGLDVWSDQDGTPGSTTYDGATNAALVPADADFGDCLELLKTQATQKLRYMGQTPMSPGCYLQISVRVKAMSGNLPGVRIAAWAGDAGGNHVTGLVETGPETTLTAYGEVYEIKAIVGSGNRQGNDMVWGTVPTYAHIGLDLTGNTGGVIRIEDIRVEDATGIFARKMMDWVDVRDYGAIGDGVTDDQPAFEAADQAANGRGILVSAGTYFLGSPLTVASRIRFEGTLTMAATDYVSFTQNFDLNTYAAAFGDEVEGLKRGLQALFNFTDHESFDLNGRRVQLSEPIDVQALVAPTDKFINRRVIRNGQLEAVSSSGWDNGVVNATASYSTANPKVLSNVTNISQVEVGSLVTGAGVGREVYVNDVNVSAGTVTLTQPLYGAASSQAYTFTRFRYALDFSGFTEFSRFHVADIEFMLNGRASGVILARSGRVNVIRNCYFNRPKDRGITSPGTACQGLWIDYNDFKSIEHGTPAQNRTSICFNVNNNDAKIRGNRASRFLHFGVMFGSGHQIEANHFFGGDDITGGQRTPGLVLTEPNCKSVITGNYIDNHSIEWNNEHDEAPDMVGELSFGSLAIDGNIFTSNDSANGFRFLIVKPYGPGHFINGLCVTANTFRHINAGTLGRVDHLDTTFATLDTTRHRNITFAGNTFHAIDEWTMNPAIIEHDENSASSVWTIDFGNVLPFSGRLRNVTSIVAEGAIRNAANATVWTQPYAQTAQGVNKTETRLNWSEPVQGRVVVTARMDNPF